MTENIIRQGGTFIGRLIGFSFLLISLPLDSISVLLEDFVIIILVSKSASQLISLLLTVDNLILELQNLRGSGRLALLPVNLAVFSIRGSHGVQIGLTIQ